ncbi:MAG: glycosyltransferase [Ferruginibacter sp.]
MSEAIKLSYVLTTYNKLPYLREVLEVLIGNCKNDEEIIIADGASTDGTTDYLQSIFQQGKIHQFISERDYGEAQGFNKAILMARGELIKIITDDDVYDFGIVQDCKNYMLSNKSVDVVFANIASISSSKGIGDLIFVKSYETWFREWKNGITKNCFVCGLSFLIRRSAISNIGLFDTTFKHIDFEYSVRITSKKVNVTYYTGLMVSAVINVDSVSYASGNIVNNEIRRVSAYYDYIYPIGVKPSAVIEKNYSLPARVLSKFKTVKEAVIEYYPDYNYPLEINMDTADISALYNELASIMKKYNQTNKPEFIENIRF